MYDWKRSRLAKGMRTVMVRTCTNCLSPVQLEIKLLPDAVRIDLHTKLTRFSLSE